MPISILNSVDSIVTFSVEGISHLQYRSRHLVYVTVEDAKIMGLDQLKKALIGTHNKCEVLAYQAHMFIMLDRAVPDYVTEISNNVIELEDLDEVERCLQMCQLWVRSCRMVVPLKPVLCVQKPTSSVKVEKEKMTIPGAISVVLKKCCTMECSKCLKTVEHKFVDGAFICDCGKRIETTFSKRELTTYHNDLQVRAYLMKTLAVRVADLTGIIINTNADRLVFPGDGVGVGALICHVLGRKYLSCDSSWVMFKYRFPNIRYNQQNFKWISSKVGKGDVVILSHVVSMEEKMMDYKWGPCVVYEHETLYHGHKDLKEVRPNFPYLRISDLKLWRSIPLRLSLEDRVIKHSVMTRYYEPGKVYYTIDTSCIRLLNYYAMLGNEVLVYPTPEIRELEGSICVTIRKSKTVVVIYKTRLGCPIDLTVSKFIDIKDDIVTQQFPFTGSLNWYEGKVNHNTLVPKTQTMVVSGSRQLTIVGEKESNYVTFVSGSVITMQPRGLVRKFVVMGGKESVNTSAEKVNDQLFLDHEYSQAIELLDTCNKKYPLIVKNQLRRKNTN